MESGIENKSVPFTRPRFSDGALLVILVALTILSPCFLPIRSGGDTLLVRAGESVFRIDLGDEGPHPVSGPRGPAVIVVKEGKAWLENSPCPLKVCESMGPVFKAGDVILCLPNRIHIKVEGKAMVDAVSR